MSSFELNKIAGAVLLAGLVVTIASIASQMVFDPHGGGHDTWHAAKHYPVPGDGELGEKVADTNALKAPDKVVAFITLLQEADASAGKKVFKKCASCHTLNDGGANKIGPNLWNIIGRNVASVAEFNYSEGMSSLGGIWDVERLGAFLADPKGYVTGTKMNFSGIKKDRKRANLVKFLASEDNGSAANEKE